MMGLWIALVALLAVAALCLVLPQWHSQPRPSVSRSALNKWLYRQRLSELDEELNQGVLEDKAASEVELARSLLDDVPDNEAQVSRNLGWGWLPGLLALVLLAGGLYYHLGAWQAVGQWQSASARFSELSNRILVERDSRVTEQDLQDFSLALRTRLKANPSDYRSWLLLGRMALDSNDADTAQQALTRAYNLAPDKSVVAVPYAQALMMTGNSSEAERLLIQALAQDPQNIEAHSIYAFMALQQEQFQLALDRWQQLLPLLEANSPRRLMVERSMSYAREQMAKRGIEIKTAPVAAVTGGFNLHVSLAAGQVVPTDPHLFVFALVPGQGAMPVAVKRLRAPTLPVTLTLTDRDAMMAGTQLSQYPKLQFKARLAQGADVMSKTGAIEGLSAAIDSAQASSSAEPIVIELNQTL
ncbi:MAG: c-type cytochrome biogenesis protein CcmI [Aeromonas sp.]